MSTRASEIGIISVTVSCDGNDIAVTGGCTIAQSDSTPDPTLALYGNIPGDTHSWTCKMNKAHSGVVTLLARATCLAEN